MQRFLSKPMLKPKSNSLFYNKTPIKTMILPESHRHRKLIGAPPNTTTDIHPFCTFECDPQINPTGLCSADCSYFCPPFCRTAESSPSPSPTTAPYSFPPPSNHHHPPLSLPLKISLIFLILTFIYSLYKFYTVCHRSRPRPTPPENQDSADDFLEVLDHPIWYIRTTGVDPSVINNLPVVKFSRINSPENQDSADDFLDCSVCLSEFEEDDSIKLLPNCNHAFHISCIDTWLRSHQNCPLCRAGIVKNTGDLTSSEQNDGDLGVNREINLGVLSDFDLGFDDSGSSGLRIGETDADELNSNLNTNLDNDSVKRNGL